MSEYSDWDDRDIVRPAEDFTSDPDFEAYCEAALYERHNEDLIDYPTEEEDTLPQSRAISEGLPSQEDIDWLIEISKQYHWNTPINIPREEFPLYRAIQIALVQAGCNYLNKNALLHYKEKEYTQGWVERWEEFYE